MTIIVVGCGKVGTTLIDQLSQEDHNICIIDEKADVVQTTANTYDVMGVVGNGASYNTLQEAGIEEADLLIAVTDSDELNLLCCIFARKSSHCATIARVRNPAYFPELGFIKKELGISMIINPEFAAATEIARLLRFPSAIEINTFAKGKIELMKFQIMPNSVLCGMKISAMHEKLGCDVLVCAVERDRETVIPTGSFELREKDRIFIIAGPGNAGEFFKKIGIPTNQAKRAMIVGGSRIAFYLAKLLANMGVQVKIIEQDKTRCEALCDLLPNAMIINGNGIEKDVLLEEGISQTDAFVALTNFDEENILLALFAKSQTNAKLITKINRITFDQVVENLELGSVVYPKHITAQYILQYVRAKQNSIGSNVETLYKIVDGRAEALEFYIQAGAPVIGVPLQELDLRPNILICSINRNGTVILPRGQDVIRQGDTVIVVTTNKGLKDIKDILKNN